MAFAKHGSDCGSNRRASDNSLIFTINDTYKGTGQTMHKVSIPSDPSVASDYSTTVTPLSIAPGVKLEQGIVPRQYSGANGGRGKYISALGVILMHQWRGPVLAYRPD